MANISHVFTRVVTTCKFVCSATFEDVETNSKHIEAMIRECWCLSGIVGRTMIGFHCVFLFSYFVSSTDNEFDNKFLNLFNTEREA